MPAPKLIRKKKAKFTKSVKKLLYKLPEFNLEKLLAHIQKVIDDSPYSLVTLVIDLFCGAGGTSEGIEKARDRYGNKNYVIIAGINHDQKAIYSQAINHPLSYYSTEDIRTANLDFIQELIGICHKRWPQCKIIVWGSLECTNHSNAKGGMSRDGDSRTLAWHLFRYIEMLNPDGIWIENVKEFFDWGPTIEKIIMQKPGKKPVTLFEYLDNEMDFFREKINDGWILTCPLETKYKKKRKKGAPIIGPKPVFIPVKSLKGTYYEPWRNKVMAYGYTCQEWFLNAADYGVPQNRKRFFPMFMKQGMSTTKPAPTHAKDPSRSHIANCKPYVPIKACLDFSIEGESIFTPGKITSPASFGRYYEGCIKFVAGGKENFIAQRNSGNPLSKIYPTDLPSRTITGTGGNQQLVEPVYFISKYMGNDQKTGVNTGVSIDDPSLTITTSNRLSLIQAQFIDVVNGNSTPSSIHKESPTVRTKDGLYLIDPEFIDPAKFILDFQGQSYAHGVNEPSPTLMTKEKLALVDIDYFILNNFSGGGQHNSINEPSPAVTTNPKSIVVEPQPFISSSHFSDHNHSIHEPSPTITANRKHHVIVNPTHGGNAHSINDPSPTVVASQHKAPLALLILDEGRFGIPVYKTDLEIVVKLKEFMALYNICDIKMRMLMVEELLKIQSFPVNYYLAGGSTDQKKFIGNAVPPLMAQRIAESMYNGMLEEYIINQQKTA